MPGRQAAAWSRWGLAVALALSAAAFADGAAAQAPSTETAVKATFLYKFAPFVEWPSSAFETPTSPLRLCVVGEDPFGPVLDQAIGGQRLEQHPIVLRRLARADRTAGCHIVYVGGAKGAPDALAAVRGAAALTVTDGASGDGARGVINFVLKDNRVRFDIDQQAAAQNGLSISAKLLSLALSVRPAS